MGKGIKIMYLYKYKSLLNFEHVAEIIVNNNFYASQYFNLNDSMEGLFNYDESTKKEYIEDIKEGKKKLRICAFSKDYKNPLLWAHYADGFKGICIKVEIDGYSQEFDIVPVDYSKNRTLFNNNVAYIRDEFPRMILSHKAKEWAIEKEVRLLTNNEYINYGLKIKSILFGKRTPEILKNTILKLSSPDIELYNTEIDDKTNKIVVGGKIKRKKVKK
jgi:hypothetical protein